MEKYINEFLEDLRNNGCTDLECYDVCIHELQLVINHLKQNRNKKAVDILNNLNQVSFEELNNNE